MIQPTRLTPIRGDGIRPLGWLRRQLEIQAAGLSGNLDKVWPDVGQSRWIGGDREGWERVPYWLDGFIPLAWLLKDNSMKARAVRYIDAILDAQEEDGWICPCPREERRRYDMWAFFLIAKVLTVYADLSGDPRVEPALRRAMRQYSSHIDGHTTFDWGASRWYECLLSILWLMEKKPEPWLVRLAHKLRAEGVDYTKIFEPYMDQQPQRRWSYLTHVVNLAMCLKQEAVASRFWGGDPDAFAQKALDALLTHHGMATGHFTGDECVAGDSPIQGSELCGVVEAMYSYEVLLSIGGNPLWGDCLERLAFNALPAAVSPDMWSHQYDQMTNQVQCVPLDPDHVVFGTNDRFAHTFGLEPHYGCCTANFGQGWPKLALSTFMTTPRGLASTVLAPAQASVALHGVPVTCTLQTDYPFRDTLRYTVAAERPVTFAFSIRIPGHAKAATVNGQPAEPGRFYTIEKEWQGGETIDVALTFEAALVPRPRGMACLWRGPLLFAVPIAEKWVRREYVADGVERKYPYCDYDVTPQSPWNYAFAGGAFEALPMEVGDMPFSPGGAPLRVRTWLARVPWRMEHGVCAEQPDSLAPLAGPEAMEMIPYGCTNLRMTELPVLPAE